MAVVRWEPFRELAALQSEMSRFMNQVWGGQGATGGDRPSTWLSAVDVWETENDLVWRSTCLVSRRTTSRSRSTDGVLTVSGKREREVKEEGDRFFRFERRFGAFSRSVTLPQGIDSER